MQTDRIHMRQEPVPGFGLGWAGLGLGLGPMARASIGFFPLSFLSPFLFPSLSFLQLSAAGPGCRHPAAWRNLQDTGERAREAIPTGRGMGDDRQGVGQERVG